MRWRFVLKKLLDDRVVGAVIVVAVLASVLVLYEGKAVADPDLEPGLASDAGGAAGNARLLRGGTRR